MVSTQRKVIKYMTLRLLISYLVIALKSEAVAWRFTGDPTDIQSTFERLDLVYTYHGRASG